MLEEFASHFLNVTLETAPDVAAQRLAVAPKSSLPAIHCLLKRFSDVDYYSGAVGMGTDSWKSNDANNRTIERSANAYLNCFAALTLWISQT